MVDKVLKRIVVCLQRLLVYCQCQASSINTEVIFKKSAETLNCYNKSQQKKMNKM